METDRFLRKNSFFNLSCVVSIVLTFFAVYITVSAFFPGFYDEDSMDQLGQATNELYRDWHSPLMSWLWSILIKLTGLTEILFIFHSIILLASGVCWVLVFNKFGFGKILIPIFLASPLVTSFSGFVIKDVGFAYSMLFSCGVLAFGIVNQEQIKRKRFTWWSTCVVSLCILFYAIGVRLNGIFSAVPVIFLIVRITMNRTNYGIWKTYVISALYTLLIFSVMIIGIQFFYYKIINAKRTYHTQYILLLDLAGISTISDNDYFPAYIRTSDKYDIQSINNAYKRAMDKETRGVANNMFYSQKLIPMNEDGKLQKKLRLVWMNTLLKEPLTYLKHRWSLFNYLIMMTPPHLHYIKISHSSERRDSLFEKNYVPKNARYFHKVNFTGDAIIKNFVEKTNLKFQKSFLALGWFWFVLLLIEFIVGIFFVRNKSFQSLILLLSSSGMLYIYPYFFIVPASHFRYLYWGVISGSVCLFCIVAWIKYMFTTSRMCRSLKLQKKFRSTE